MSDLKRFSDPVWDRFFDFVFPCDESMTRAEVQEELRRLGIDVKGAVRKVQFALQSAQAKAELQAAKAHRSLLSEKLEHVVIPAVKGLRDNLREMINRRFRGTVQAAYFRKLETAASDADLQSLLEDIHKLDALSEDPDDEGTGTK